jgi:hypothetical protein
MSQETAPTNQYAAILEHAESSPKPNWTQYQLAIAELDARLNVSAATSAAYRKLRNLMETKFGLTTIDFLVDGAGENP